MDASWTLTVILCSFVCDARLSLNPNKTVPIIGPAVPETWDEVHMIAPNINADNDLSILAAVLQKSFVAVSLTSATNISGDDWFFSETSTSSAISTCRKTFIVIANSSSDLSRFFALRTNFNSNNLVSPFSQYIYLLPMLDNDIYIIMYNIWILRGAYNQLVLLRNGRRYRYYPFSNYGQNLNTLESFDFPRIPLKMNGSKLSVYLSKEKENQQGLMVLKSICMVMDCKLSSTNFQPLYFRLDVTSVLSSVGPRTDFDYGPPIVYYCFAVFTPVPKEFAPWKQLLLTFSLELWVAIGAAYVCFVLAWYTMSRWSWPHETLSPPSLLRSATHTVRVLLAMEWPRSLQDASRGAPQRAMLAGLMLLSLVIVTTYQSCLVDVQQNPRKSKPINTLEELQRSGIPIYYTMNFTDFVDTPLLTKLKKQMHYSVETKHFKDIDSGAQYAMIELQNLLNLLSHFFTIGKGHICKETILCSYSSFNQPFRSPLSEAIHLAYWQLKQASLVPLPFSRSIEIYWHLDIHAPKLLTLNDLKPAYCLLFAGLCASLCVFLIEYREQIKVQLKSVLEVNNFPFFNCKE